MSVFTAIKRAFLTASVVLAFISLPVMANQTGQCKAPTINFLVAPQVTPALLEMLRHESGATTVRVEKPGHGYTQEFDLNRLRVLVDDTNHLIHYVCG